MGLDLDTIKPKRFNLKLPPNARTQFQDPFDAYLAYLLSISNHLTTPFDESWNRKLFDAPRASGSSSRWTLWVSKEIRKQFDNRKRLLCPNKTHGGFVELLLLYRNYLESIGQLPLFDKDCVASMSRRSSGISGNSESNLGSPSETGFGMSADSLFSYGQYNTVSNPLFSHSTPEFNFVSGDTNNDLYSHLYSSKGQLDRLRSRRNVTGSLSDPKNRGNTYGSISSRPSKKYATTSTLTADITSPPHFALQPATTVNNISENLSQNLFASLHYNSPKTTHDNAAKMFRVDDEISKEDTLLDLGPLYQSLSFNGYNFELDL